MIIPTIGRIVLYTLTKYNADTQNKCRADAVSSNTGSQLHSGNAVSEGEVYPMIITRVWGSKEDSAVNGQVFLDGNDQLWVTSTAVGEGPGTFSWPVKSEPESQTNTVSKSSTEEPKSSTLPTAKTTTEPKKTASDKPPAKTASAKPPAKTASARSQYRKKG